MKHFSLASSSRSFRFLSLLPFFVGLALADGPSDNSEEKVRPVPPPGVEVPDDVKAQAESELKLLAALSENGKNLLTELSIKAIRRVVFEGETWEVPKKGWFGDSASLCSLPSTYDKAKKPFLLGNPQLGGNPRCWVGAYKSKIDDSVQPFGLVVPSEMAKTGPHRNKAYPLHIWFHGRGEKLSELDFMRQRLTSLGEFAPEGAIVLHPYGRYCNGGRLAGETDTFEAMEEVKKHFNIDEDRIVVRGFSLGGANTWHMAAHFTHLWCAATPGAGFSETEEFLNFFQGETLKPQPWERQLWGMYDATAVAQNFLSLPLIAYSGEVDKQRQAAVAMEKTLAQYGLTLSHVIGAGMGHKYDAASKTEIERRLAPTLASGRPAWQAEVSHTTYTLRYDKGRNLQIESLTEHWKPGSVTVRNIGKEIVSADVQGVEAFTFEMPMRNDQADAFAKLPQQIEFQLREGANSPVPFSLRPQTDDWFRVSFHKQDSQWKLGKRPDPAPGELRKRHGLTGPIDDAFFDRFLFVRPTGQAANEKAGAWAKAEMERAIREWHRHFRGDVLIKDDKDVTEKDWQECHLVLWGDPSSNSLIAQVSGKLPIQWQKESITVGPKTFPAAEHALACIYPNPLNPNRYVVLNSGFTWREYDYLNNARQTPKLPDWAVIDLKAPAGPRRPGGIAAAEFFDESWKLKP